MGNQPSPKEKLIAQFDSPGNDHNELIRIRELNGEKYVLITTNEIGIKRTRVNVIDSKVEEPLDEDSIILLEMMNHDNPNQVSYFTRCKFMEYEVDKTHSTLKRDDGVAESGSQKVCVINMNFDNKYSINKIHVPESSIIKLQINSDDINYMIYKFIMSEGC